MNNSIRMARCCAAAVFLLAIAAVVSFSTIVTAAPAPYPHAPGDPTGDGRINAGDITRLELCILYPAMYPKEDYPGWDANEDGMGPNSGDILTVGYMIIESWPLNHVHIQAPDEARYCTSFAALVHVTRVENFGHAVYEITYNASVLEVTGVGNGSMVERQTDGTALFHDVEVTGWEMPSGQGTVRITSDVTGTAGVTGAGYLSSVQFHVISSEPCDTSDLVFNVSACALYDDSEPVPGLISSTWAGDSIHVAPVPTPTATPTSTATPTPTSTATPTPTSTATPTPTSTATPTPTSTATPTPTSTAMPTPTSTATPTPTSTADVTIYIDAPAEVPAGGSFTAYVRITEVKKLAAADYDVTYDPSVLEITDVYRHVASGVIGGATFPLKMWDLAPRGVQGRVRIIQHTGIGGGSVSGTGYMSAITFRVIGSTGATSAITPMPGPNDGGLFNSLVQKIPADWESDSVHVQ